MADMQMTQSPTRLARAAGRPARLAVRIVDGETVHLVVRVVRDGAGAVARVIVPPAPTSDPREAAARRLVQAIDAQLCRGDAPGLLAIQRDAELVADLAEQLRDIEAQGSGA